MVQSVPKFITKSAILKKLTLVVLVLTLNPQSSHQKVAADQFSTIEATCVYSLDSRSNYQCTISNVEVLNPTDVLNIVGSHLEGYADANVQSFSYDKSKILYFNGEVFQKFPNIKFFNIVNQGLIEVAASAFENCPNLEEIIIGFNDQLTALPSQMLANCQNFRNFIVIYNSLTAIPADLFGSTSNLEKFHVQNNQLTALPGNLLQNMQKLRFFDIFTNFLSELDPNLLKNAQNLEEVHIGNNKFADQQQVTNALNGFTNLTVLSLRGNNFPNFDFQFFEQFQRLKRLEVGSIKEISWYSLPTSLVELTVDGIGGDIPENAFESLINLSSLSLTGSGVENLQKDTFKSLTALQELYVEQTSIKVLHPELFTNLINLRTLNLDNNKIEELPAGIFAPLVNLGIGNENQGINMNSNNIQRLNSNAFGQHPHMRHINFYQNRINEIERGLFSKFHSNMTTANFWNNICINRSFSYATNLDENENLLWCFNNWAGITTTTTTTSTQPSPTTTPGGCGGVFRKFEVVLMIFIGFVKFLINQ